MSVAIAVDGGGIIITTALVQSAIANLRLQIVCDNIFALKNLTVLLMSSFLKF